MYALVASLLESVHCVLGLVASCCASQGAGVEQVILGLARCTHLANDIRREVSAVFMVI